MAGRTDPLRRSAALRSVHKWVLGGGWRILWAPEFPVFLDRPGFWDPGTYLELPIGGLLTWSILEDGVALDLAARGREWMPHVLRTEFAGPRMRLTEQKSIAADDRFCSALVVKNLARRPRVIDCVLWARIDATDAGSPRICGRRAGVDGIAAEYATFAAGGQEEHRVELLWQLHYEIAGAPVPADSYGVQNSEPGDPRPDWRVTPFFELFSGRALPDTAEWSGGIEGRSSGKPQKKSVFIALHRRIRLGAGKTTQLSGACRIQPIDEKSAADGALQKPQPQKARRAATPLAGNRIETKAAAAQLGDWPRFFEGVPEFRCSDAYFEKYFDYRWFGLRLNAIDHGRPPLRHPCVFEGVNPGWFRHAISYSAQVLPRDLRWMHDPRLARGCILNFLENQHADGFIPGGLLTGAHERERHTEHMYHADWGSAIRAVHEIHPERDFLRACQGPLSRCADWFERARDAEQSGLYDVCSQAETGQEYMSRYLFVDPRADEWGPLRLKGVDATVYLHQTQRALAWIADELGDAAGAQRWHLRAVTTLTAVRTRMWDGGQQKFCDLDPRDGRRSPVLALTDFYPFMTDIATAEHLAALHAHLFNPAEFWTQWPAPATALTDPLADAAGRWRGKRQVCPWNGRTWLMTNSHIAEALAHATLTLDPRLEPYAVTFITRFIQMLFVDGDLNRPTSFEYYNPHTAAPPCFRGVDDYMHSWIIDLIMKYVVGLRPQADGAIVVQPLMFGLRSFALKNCRVSGREVEVAWDGKRLTARVGERRESIRGYGRLVFRAPSK